MSLSDSYQTYSLSLVGKGGLAGGKGAGKLTPDQWSEIAKIAA